MIGHEKEVNEMREEIERLICERNNMHEGINARRRLRRRLRINARRRLRS